MLILILIISESPCKNRISSLKVMELKTEQTVVNWTQQHCWPEVVTHKIGHAIYTLLNSMKNMQSWNLRNLEIA